MSSRHLLIVAVVGLFSSAHADTIYVDDDNCPGPGSGTVGDPYCSIQTAIDNAVDFDEIVVAEGIYFETINFLGKAITVRSSNPDDPYVVADTTINGTGYFHVVQCVNGEGPFTILEGFTITGGDASGGGEDGYGGGMYNYNSSPTVANCVFSDNRANHGGGMFNWEYSSPTVTDCAFMNNSALNQGGGMHNSVSCDPTVANCTFSGNMADLGGGMCNTDSCIPTVTNCTFSGNTADSSGGGMFNITGSSPMVNNCTFSGNSADSSGGGMHNYDSSSPTVTNCTFSGNTADSSGGGMYNFDSSSPTVTNSTFSGNEAVNGGGMYNRRSCIPTVTNCIFWGDTPNEIDNTIGSTPLFSYSDVQGSGGSGAWDPSVGTDGGGNIDGDPLLANPAGGNLRLLRHSPCTDAGNTTAVPPGVFTDLAGNPRCVDDAGVPDTGVGNPCVDMGAYERQSDSAGPVTVPADFITIQEAIDYCIDGEEILVAPGTYFESINFWGKAITLRSSDGPDVTVI
ncbi:MAG: right-handed parallel beta-helix repeat-containing protein, partial [Planctomycetota bacterium]